MSEEKEGRRSRRDRAYDLHFLKKLGDLADFSGRALVAAGLGGGIVAKLAQEKVPTAGLWEWTMAFAGVALIYLGIAWQAQAEADKEHGDV
jgi:sulfite exporter TauE/SafE